MAGRSFHHGRFVQKLRHRAASQPTVVCREATVRKLINGERCKMALLAVLQQQHDYVLVQQQLRGFNR